jgi:Ca-activated chloride channel homolog
MSLLWPDFLALLVLLPILVGVYVWAQRRKRPVGARYSSLALIREAQPGSSRLRRHLPFALFVIALGGMVLALARPVAVVAVPTGQRTIILAIDVSGSMCSSDIPPNRLLAAEAAATQFIQREGGNSEIGIVAFASFGAVIQAPTSDQQLLLDAIHSLTTGRRTAIGSGILESIDALAAADPSIAPAITDTSPGVEPAPVPKGAYAPGIIVLLTDGANNAGPTPTDAAQQAADRGIRIYTIGFGTANGGPIVNCGSAFTGREPGGGGGFGGGGFGGGGGGPGGGNFRRGIDEDTLKQVADATGGTYYPAESSDDLQSVFNGLPTYLIVKHEVIEVGAIFLAVAAAFAGAGFLLARLWRPLP